MARKKTHSPLLGYNTNVRHAGKLFHIQTEDSGVGHPHIITHLFTKGTILATKKTSYSHLLEDPELEIGIRRMMKDQHKAMFIELRDGVHDPVTSTILGEPIGDAAPEVDEESDPAAADQTQEDIPAPADSEHEQPEGVRVVKPSVVDSKTPKAPYEETRHNDLTGRSIFDTPAEHGDFGDSLITDKSLDEVILSYLTEELDE